MARRGGHRRAHGHGGRATPPGTRPGSFGPAPAHRYPPAGEPDLMAEVRRLLRGDALDLLTWTSTLVAAVDPRRGGRFQSDPATRRAGREPTTLEELVATFIDVVRPETTALLAGIAELAPDELMRARARRAVRDRHHQLPVWLARLGESEVYRAVEMVHVLGDGDDEMLGVRLPDGEELTVLVYVDHNLGTVAKDAFVVDRRLEAVIDLMRDRAEARDMRWIDVDLADARARIAEALERGDSTFPPFESATWPSCQPLVEWAIRRLPEGGRGYRRPEWDETAVRELSERFFASVHGRALDDEGHRHLLEAVLWYGTDYGTGDPQHWSPVPVEILLTDWVPRKIAAAPDFLAALPELLRAFVRFCHAERGIRPELTAEVLAAVDELEPGYQATIRSPRPQGAPGLATGAVLLDDAYWVDEDADDELDDDMDEGFDLAFETFDDVVREILEGAVGGPAALATLRTDPLPDEDFSWSGVPDEIRDRVTEVLKRCDSWSDALGDVEYRTACRRLLARVAAGEPDAIRRGRADTAAAGLCWAVGSANNLFRQRKTGVRVKDLAAHFGLSQGGFSQRATTLLRGAGITASSPFGGPQLGSPDLLVADRRRQIIELRNHYL